MTIISVHITDKRRIASTKLRSFLGLQCMIQGKLSAAMHWLTERSKGHVFQPNDQVRLDIDS